MINQAIHSLDILQWLCGMPEAVLAYVSNNSLQDKIEVEDTAFGIFSLNNGGEFRSTRYQCGEKHLSRVYGV